MNTFKVFAVFLVLFFGLISFTNAHFEIKNPPSRGHSESKMTESPCGGFNDVNAKAITEFPVTGENILKNFISHDIIHYLNYLIWKFLFFFF
jgi:hypothetical protein